MNILYCNSFETLDNDQHSSVFEVLPNVFNDSRGSFSEVIKNQNYWPKDNVPLWFSEISWIKQINRSVSSSGTIRGCHAQKAPMCQGKLVEALTCKIYDIITDARPESSTFGVSEVFVLDPAKQNKLWVPRGFLHSFVVPYSSESATFQYFCDNTYSKEHEFGIQPMTLLPKVVDSLKNMHDKLIDEKFADLYDVFNKNDIQLSQKDLNGLDYETFMNDTKKKFKDTRKIWYRDWH